ncbi:MAG TPA: hypothetical protein VE010_07625 [Thermoanaerobaculia bacterium]|nr:hypothetical protein [Thermoanaerobaculia bacterium]
MVRGDWAIDGVFPSTAARLGALRRLRWCFVLQIGNDAFADDRPEIFLFRAFLGFPLRALLGFFGLALALLLFSLPLYK